MKTIVKSMVIVITMHYTEAGTHFCALPAKISPYISNRNVGLLSELLLSIQKASEDFLQSLSYGVTFICHIIVSSLMIHFIAIFFSLSVEATKSGAGKFTVQNH
jgi:hypothetical protein